MKLIFKLLILISIISCSPNQQNYFIVEGETNRVGDAILLKISPTSSNIDTTSIKNGKFSFKKSINEEELFRLKFYDGSSVDLLANIGETINITFKEDDLAISGSKGSEKLIELNDKLFELLTFRDSITRELQGLSRDENYEQTMLEYREQFLDKLEIHQKYLQNFIELNKNSKTCLMALFQTYGSSSPVLTVDEHLEDFEKVLANLKLNFPKSDHIPLLEQEITALKPLSHGQIAPEFTLPDINKNPVSVSDFKGKVLLIDFWASWCKPCRIENPKLVKLYKKYSNLGFEILSVSLDGTARQKEPKKAWIDAINDDNLNDWIHVSELKGWNTHVREIYNLNSIPYTVLINKAGQIVAKNIKGNRLETKIQELLGNE